MVDGTLVSSTLLKRGKASIHQGMMGQQQQPMRGQHCLDWLQGRQMHFGHARSEHLNFPTFIFWHPITQIIGHMLILVKAYTLHCCCSSSCIDQGTTAYSEPWSKYESKWGQIFQKCTKPKFFPLSNRYTCYLFLEMYQAYHGIKPKHCSKFDKILYFQILI